MIIRKIKLENIRSYVNQEIELPDGTVLLSGNIGSGKSTILLAIEFALFGLLKGDLTGSTLLRNGTNKGSVELFLDIDGKEASIKRVLKKNSNTIAQDSGSFALNNEVKLLSPVEIKQHVLNLINYPKEFLTQTKSLIYRYTVYTPQEEMKNILFSSNELRLDILRKVFGIDKYKRIRENSRIFLSKLKERKSQLLIKADGLSEDIQEKDKIIYEISKLSNDRNTLDDEIKDLVKKIVLLKSEVKDKEELANKLRMLKNELNIIDVKIKNENLKLERNSKEKERLREEIKELEKEVFPVESYDGNLEGNIKIKEEAIKEFDADIIEVLNNIQDIKTRKANSQAIIQKINVLDICPLCKQNVSHDHKSSIENIESNNINQLNKDLENLNRKYNDLNSENNSYKKEFENLKLLKNKVYIVKLKKANLMDKNKQLNLIDAYSEEILKELTNMNAQEKEIKSKISGIPEYNFDIIKDELESLNSDLKTLEISKGKIDKDIENKSLILERLKESVESKLKVRDDIGKIEELNHFIDENFLNLIDVMERNIMLRIHSDFNSLFQKWFSILMSNDDINIRLEKDFTPVIEQNGYETNYYDLSGGEKTATALAYRLALNQVINNIVTVIKTKDLIILDEPTDGFSEEQIDKIRDVLNELNMRQIIIVSHEPKIESFVNNIIRLEKKEHVTRIIA